MRDETRRSTADDAHETLEPVQHEGSPRDIAAGFDSAVRDLYWKAKDLVAVIALAREGIQYCLTTMGEATDPDDRIFFGDSAKTLAYNLASFTWPGWDEPGISPSPDDLAVGLSAARLNLRLALELNKPVDRVEDAHWLLGAHLLAAHLPEAALEEFEACSPATRPLFAGYSLLAQAIIGVPDAQRRFDDLLSSINGDQGGGSDPGARQLATAHRVFIARSPG